MLTIFFIEPSISILYDFTHSNLRATKLVVSPSLGDNTMLKSLISSYAEKLLPFHVAFP